MDFWLDSVDFWLESHNACDKALKWVSNQPDKAPKALIRACTCVDWLLWVAFECGYDPAVLAQAIRPAILRALREYAPPELDAAGLHEHATSLRNLPDDVDLAIATQIAREAKVAARKAGARDAMEAAEVGETWDEAKREERGAEWWASAWIVEATEHARCADEVRAALPDLAERWAAAISDLAERWDANLAKE